MHFDIPAYIPRSSLQHQAYCPFYTLARGPSDCSSSVLGCSSSDRSLEQSQYRIQLMMRGHTCRHEQSACLSQGLPYFWAGYHLIVRSIVEDDHPDAQLQKSRVPISNVIMYELHLRYRRHLGRRLFITPAEGISGILVRFFRAFFCERRGSSKGS